MTIPTGLPVGTDISRRSVLLGGVTLGLLGLVG